MFPQYLNELKSDLTHFDYKKAILLGPIHVYSLTLEPMKKLEIVFSTFASRDVMVNI